MMTTANGKACAQSIHATQCECAPPDYFGSRRGFLQALGAAVERGLPKGALRNVARHLYSEASEQRTLMYRIVPEATFKRRKDRLTPTESARTERLAVR